MSWLLSSFPQGLALLCTLSKGVLDLKNTFLKNINVPHTTVLVVIICQSQSHSLLEKLIDAARILHVPRGIPAPLSYLHALPYQQPPPGAAWTHPIPPSIPVHPR